MKKLAPLALALSLALGPVAVAAAQDGGVAAPGAHGEHGPGECRHGGPGRGRGGPGFGRGMHGDPAAHAEHRLRMLTAILDLDARQQASVRDILTQSATEAQALFQQGRSEEGRAAMDALRQRTEQRIEAVLSPTQRATFVRVRAAHEQERAAHRERMGARMGERRQERAGGGAR